MPSRVNEVGVAQIGTEQYRLVRTDKREAWGMEYRDEPPWDQGLPDILSEPSTTWHLGGLRSTFSPGVSEYGENTDCRWANRVTQAPLITTLTLSGSVTAPHNMFEAWGYLWVVCSPGLYRVNPVDDTVHLSKNFNPESPVMGVNWENLPLLTMTNPAQAIWYLTFIGPPDTWLQGTAFGRLLAAGSDRLFKVTNTGELRNVLSGLNPTVGANYADKVQMGDTNFVPAGLVAYENTAVVGKKDGIFGVGTDGKGRPLFRRFISDDYLGVGLSVIEPHIMIPHARGTYRFQPGLVEAVGIERELDNKSPIKGRFYGFISDGERIYGLLVDGNDLWLMVARERSDNEEGFGPIAWDTLVKLAPGVSMPASALFISTLWNPPRLFFPNGRNLGYMTLPRQGGTPDIDDPAHRFQAGFGYRYTGRYNFGTWLDKDFQKIQVACKNVTATRYWRVHYSVDGGAWLAADANGVAIEIKSEGLKTFTLSTAAIGREIQFRFEWLSGIGQDEDEKTELVYFEPFAVPISRKLPSYTAQLYLAQDTRYSGGLETRLATDQLADLVTLNENSAVIGIKGPWGDLVGRLRHLKLVEVIQEGVRAPEFLVEVAFQSREDPASD